MAVVLQQLLLHLPHNAMEYQLQVGAAVQLPTSATLEEVIVILIHTAVDL
jgi:hypothetical protein